MSLQRIVNYVLSRRSALVFLYKDILRSGTANSDVCFRAFMHQSSGFSARIDPGSAVTN